MKPYTVSDSISVDIAPLGVVRIVQAFGNGHPVQRVYLERTTIDELIAVLLKFKPSFLERGAGI